MDPQKAFKYCLNCGSHWECNGKNKFTCPHCGFIFYLNPSPCAVLYIINEKNELLFVQRKFAPFAGSWDIPGGFIELGETAEEAAYREAKEELGLKIRKLSYLASFADRYEFRNVNYYTLGFLYRVLISGNGKSGTDKITPGDDAAAVRFYTRDNIPWQEVKFPTVREGIKKYFVDYQNQE